MNAVRSQIDAELEVFQPPHRSRAAQARFERHRDEVLADRTSTPLAKVRVTFRGVGLTREELSDRTGGRVSVSTIQRAERIDRFQAIGDDSWAALAAALCEPNGKALNRRTVVGCFKTICPTALYV